MVITTTDALQHVGYEWRMYRTMGTLAENLKGIDDPVRDAILESLALHARALSEFLFCRSQAKEMRNVLGIADQREPSAIKSFLIEANQFVNHLSPKRITKIKWDYEPVTKCFETRLRELRDAQIIPATGWDGDEDILENIICWNRVRNIECPQSSQSGSGTQRPTEYKPLLGVVEATGSTGSVTPSIILKTGP